MGAVFRRVIAGIILGPALLIGSFAWWGFLALRTVFDETRTQTIAEELLDNEAVVDQIGNNIGTALEAAMPDSVQLDDEQVAAGVEIILTDPVVRDLIIASLGTTHRAFLGLDDAPATIDLGPALESSKERIGIFAPTVAEQIPDSFEVDLPTERIPDASPVKGFLERSVPLLAGIAVTLALLAFLTTSDRSQVLGKAARWAIGTTAFYLIVGLGLPCLIRRFAPDQAEVLAALLAAVLRAALIPSIVLAVVGIVLLASSMFWPDPGRRKDRARASRASARQPPPAAAPPTPAPTIARPTPVASSPSPSPSPASSRPAAPTTAMPAAPVAPRPTPAPAPVVPPTPSPLPTPPPAPSIPVPPRPTLPTRARPPDSVGLPAWTGEPVTEDGGVAGPEPKKWRAPTWVEGHGWVMDPDDPRDPPSNARFVDGVGWVVPGPPPS